MDQLKQIENKREERLRKQEAIIKEYEEKKAADLKDTQKQIEEEKEAIKDVVEKDTTEEADTETNSSARPEICNR